MARIRVHQPWRIAIAILIVGVMLRVLHLPLASEVLILGFVGILVLYPLHFMRKRTKTFLDYAKLFFIVFFTLNYAFQLFHLPYDFVFVRLAQLSLVVLVIAYIVHTKNSKKDGLETLLYTIAGVGIVGGAILKILHLGYGNILLVVGMIAGVVSVLIGGSSSEK